MGICSPLISSLRPSTLPRPEQSSCLQNAIESFDARPDMRNPTKKASKGLEKAIKAAKEEIESMAKVLRRLNPFDICGSWGLSSPVALPRPPHEYPDMSSVVGDHYG